MNEPVQEFKGLQIVLMAEDDEDEEKGEVRAEVQQSDI